MKPIRLNPLALTLAAALMLPLPALSADATADSTAAATPPASASAGAPAVPSLQTMRERMMEMHASQDPEKRKEMMESMRDKHAGCRMTDGDAKPMGMMGMGMGMGPGPGPGNMMADGQACHKMHANAGGDGKPGCGMGKHGEGHGGSRHAVMEQRVESLENRMDMMQMMMRMMMKD